MARRRQYEFFDDELLARLERLHLIAKRLAARGHPGPRRSRRLGDGLEFADHRDYTPGDDIRFIDWPYYARMEKLMLRLFHEHSESDVAVMLDTSASMAPGDAMTKFNYARRAAAALAYVAMGSGQRVVIAPFAEQPGDVMRTGRNRSQIFEVLDYLASLSPAGQTHLSNCAETLIRRDGSIGTVLLISDLLDCHDDLPAAMAKLAAWHADIIVLHIYAVEDAVPQLSGPLLLSEAETGRRMTVTITEKLLDSYKKRWQEFRTRCEKVCTARGITYIAAHTGLSFEKLVLSSLRQAGVISG